VQSPDLLHVVQGPEQSERASACLHRHGGDVGCVGAGAHPREIRTMVLWSVLAKLLQVPARNKQAINQQSINKQTSKQTNKRAFGVALFDTGCLYYSGTTGRMTYIVCTLLYDVRHDNQQSHKPRKRKRKKKKKREKGKGKRKRQTNQNKPKTKT
jgi:hypothetical protein